MTTGLRYKLSFARKLLLATMGVCAIAGPLVFGQIGAIANSVVIARLMQGRMPVPPPKEPAPTPALMDVITRTPAKAQLPVPKSDVQPKAAAAPILGADGPSPCGNGSMRHMLRRSVTRHRS
jgi:hypothetical protein